MKDTAPVVFRNKDIYKTLKRAEAASVKEKGELYSFMGVCVLSSLAAEWGKEHPDGKKLLKKEPLQAVAAGAIPIGAIPALDEFAIVLQGVGEGATLLEMIQAAGATVGEAVQLAGAAIVEAAAGAIAALKASAFATGVVGLLITTGIAMCVWFDKEEMVTILIINRTKKKWTQSKMYRHWGDCTLRPVGKNSDEPEIPANTESMKENEQQLVCTYQFQKGWGGYGTEGVIQLNTKDDMLTIGFYQPFTGSNACGLSLDPDYPVGEAAWHRLVDDGRRRVPNQIETNKRYKVMAGVSSTSGGDSTLIVYIDDA